MCTYNGEKYIKEQLDSILNQKDLDVTILISDDCSTDNTPNILQFYSEKYSNVKYRINKTNLNFTYNFINLIFDNYDLVKSFDYYIV